MLAHQIRPQELQALEKIAHITAGIHLMGYSAIHANQQDQNFGHTAIKIQSQNQETLVIVWEFNSAILKIT